MEYNLKQLVVKSSKKGDRATKFEQPTHSVLLFFFSSLDGYSKKTNEVENFMNENISTSFIHIFYLYSSLHYLLIKYTNAYFQSMNVVLRHDEQCEKT